MTELVQSADQGVYLKVREAILKQRQLVAEHEGYVREMCPYAFGVRDGAPCGLFYQFGGGNKVPLEARTAANRWRTRWTSCARWQRERAPWKGAGPLPRVARTCLDWTDVRYCAVASSGRSRRSSAAS